MPHEKIFSLDATPNDANCVQVAWGSPSSPSNTGPGHGNGEGHVMVIVERPNVSGRMASSIEEVRRRLPGLLATIREWEVSAGGGEADSDDSLVEYLIDSDHLADLVYAFGYPVERLAVMLDRPGCNKLIRATRKGRDVAFGRDE